MPIGLRKNDVISSACPLRIVSGRCEVEIPADYQLLIDAEGNKHVVPRAEVDRDSKTADTLD